MPPAAPPGFTRLRRLGALALGALALAFGTRQYGGELYGRYERWRWPAIPAGNSQLSKDIEEDRLRVEYLELRGRYLRTGMRIVEAETAGRSVDFLKPKMNKVKDLLEAGKFSYAKTLLNSVELQIPNKSELVRVAEKQEVKAEEFFRERGRGPETLERSVRKPRRRGRTKR